MAREYEIIHKEIKDADGVTCYIKTGEIVRCKDCKYAYMTADGECKYCDIWFPDDRLYLPGDYFCASAERKGEQNGKAG